MADVATDREYLTRKEAAQYLSTRWFPIAPSTLAVKAVEKSGPAYTKVGRVVFYARQALDDWARSQFHDGAPQIPQPSGALAALSRRE